MTSTTDRKSICPHCGRENEQQTGQTGTRPKSGDLGICFFCGGLQVFTEAGVRLPTAEENAMFEDDPHVRILVERIRARFGSPGLMTKEKPS